jgi:hypothetical protein
MELAHMTKIKTAAPDKEVRQRMKAVSLRVLDGLDTVLDGMTPPPEAPAPAIAVKRRLIANIMRLWMFCDRTQCHRSRCCRGEPRNCLSIGMTVLPPEAFDPLLTQNGKDRKRDRHRRYDARLASANFAAQTRD